MTNSNNPKKQQKKNAPKPEKKGDATIPNIGITMADGGARLDGQSKADEWNFDDDPPNIIRSVN